MTINEDIIKAALQTLGLPFEYRQFTEEDAVPPPYILWYFDESNNFYADNELYIQIYELDIELYTGEKDFQLERHVEAVLKELGLTWQKEEQWIEAESMFEVLYYTEVYYAGNEQEE